MDMEQYKQYTEQRKEYDFLEILEDALDEPPHDLLNLKNGVANICLPFHIK